MAIRCRYKSIKRPDGFKCYGPWIPVTLRGSEETIELIFLLDSGADYTVLPIDIAEILGLDLSKQAEKTKGVGGEVDTIQSDVMVNIKNSHEEYTFRIPICVLMDRNSRVPPLLGRMGFFDEFEIKIKQKRGIITLKREYDPSY